MTFAEASAIKGSPGSWTAEIQEGWDIFGISNGGYLMAVATRETAATLPAALLLCELCRADRLPWREIGHPSTRQGSYCMPRLPHWC